MDGLAKKLTDNFILIAIMLRRSATQLAIMYHVTSYSNFGRAFNKYERKFDKAMIPESSFPDKFFLLYQNELDIGFQKAKRLLKKPEEEYLVISTQVDSEEELTPADTGLGQSIDRDYIIVDKVYNKEMQPLIIEEVMARSILLNSDMLLPYEELKPLTISLLPIAQGCQAKCPFCFSHASISDEQLHKNYLKQLPRVKEVLAASQDAGAKRAVITGGGEPGLVRHDYLCELIHQCSSRFPKTVLITNGYMLGNLKEELRLKRLTDLINSGLNVLSVSRHGFNSLHNQRLMYLETKSDQIAKTIYKNNLPITLRWVCVLQKGGVKDMRTMELYMDFVKETQAPQVCFKELYFSTSVESVYHDHKSNQFSLKNQVPLKLVFDFCEKYGFVQIAKLPWGSLIFAGEYKGHPVQIAAYTEPSVFWERTHGVCRSWNLLADGRVYASLEDNNSCISSSNENTF